MEVRSQPDYFATIRALAERRWAQLEGDRDLAGPWHHLFSQVQSPRHVLSELLQNADDAGATWATARVEGGSFTLEHDGKDFTAEQFGSLCRFGFSNKRTLHTIGFRGIGFKSTFSLGETVQVLSPSVAVRFHRDRFTLPEWDEAAPATTATSIRVQIEDRERERELRANIEEWANSPVSLLFFRSIRHLRLGGKEVERVHLGPGPIPNSERIRLLGAESNEVVVIRSEEESFPPDAVAEIRGERSVGGEALDLPPCSVELVVGLRGDQRLYVVLPTDVRPPLPFSCNAPFLQDPARLGIKAPSLSATNRWLLYRAGRLAAEAMQAWLRNSVLPSSERAEAYELVPDVTKADLSPAGACRDAVLQSLKETLASAPLLLSSQGTIIPKSSCIAPPLDLYDAWSPEQLAPLLGGQGFETLAQEVTTTQRKRLAACGWLGLLDDDAAIDRLSGATRVPRPHSWQRVAALWRYVQRWARRQYWGRDKIRSLPIVPAAGDEYLLSSIQVVRVSAAGGKLDEADLEFLLGRVRAVDGAWLEHVGSDRQANPTPDPVLGPVRDLLGDLGFDRATPPEDIALRAFRAAMGAPRPALADAVRITRLLVRLDAQAPDEFQYFTRDGSVQVVANGLSADATGELTLLLPQEYAAKHILHDEYASGLDAASLTTWRGWAESGRSRLMPFVGIVLVPRTLWSMADLGRLLGGRGGTDPDFLHYKSEHFEIRDFDFAPDLIQSWRGSEDSVLPEVVSLISRHPGPVLEALSGVTVVQVSQQYTKKPIGCGRPRAAWSERLRGRPCLRDTHGVPRVPAELLMRTPATEGLQDVEEFVDPRLDTPENKPLLHLLGVRDTPTGVDRLLDRLRAISMAESLLLSEASKWCGRIDQVLLQSKPETLVELRRTFAEEALVPTQDGTWVRSQEAFLTADGEEIPGLPLVHPAVKDLSLWHRLGVSTRPSAEAALAWLRTIPAGKRLSIEEMRRVQAVLQRFPERVLVELGFWPAHDRTWSDLSTFKWKATKRAPLPATSIFPDIRSKTADLQFLAEELLNAAPIASLPDLGRVLEFRLTGGGADVSDESTPPWACEVSRCLAHFTTDDDEAAHRIRETARRLGRTGWHRVRLIRAEPCIEGTPAGEPVDRRALWHNESLFIHEGESFATLEDVVRELSRPFENTRIEDALRACYDRDPEWVRRFLEHEFQIVVPADADPTGNPDPTGATPPSSSSPGPPRQGEPAQVPPSPPTSPPPDEDAPAPGPDPPPAEGDTEEVPPQDAPPEPPPKRPPPRPDGPSPFERFAARGGYAWDPSLRLFSHRDGSCIKRAESPFHWERFSSRGESNCRYWESSHSLAREGIDIDSAAWSLLRDAPHAVSVVSVSEDGEAIELLGTELQQMLRDGTLTVFNARMRIRRTGTP